MFPVGKAGGKQRVVWNATPISFAAARPPAPLHLADPASFGQLDVQSGVQLRVTKRDCKTWFDHMSVCEDIGDFFGRPRISRSELRDVGISDDDIISIGGISEQDSFFPC